jgi:hypothetical protein
VAFPLYNKKALGYQRDFLNEETSRRENYGQRDAPTQYINIEMSIIASEVGYRIIIIIIQRRFICKLAADWLDLRD